jgi:ribosome recycling factor
MADVIKETEKRMNGVIDHLKHELKGLRTGRANPAMVETVIVEVYGTQMRLTELASISVPESRQLLISPYDNKNIHAISKGIEAANLNLRPVVDGGVVRIKIPEMDQNMRQEMVKQGKKKTEEAKVGIRNARRDGNESLKKQKAASEISEDILKKNEKKIQELTDKFCTLADKICEEKEREITTI